MQNSTFFSTKQFLLAAFASALLLLLSGCGTSPQEKRGVSNIPINSQNTGDTRSFNGQF